MDKPCKMPCYHCIEAFDLKAGPTDSPADRLPLSSRMIPYCEICGFKRCPHASDCSLACTKSDDFGQPGSIYIDTQKKSKQ